MDEMVHTVLGYLWKAFLLSLQQVFVLIGPGLLFALLMNYLAGSVQKAEELYSLAQSYQKVRAGVDASAVAEAEGNLDEAFEQAEGDIFATIREAQSYGFEKARLARATGERFAEQLKAYMAAPEIYRRELLLGVLEESLANIRKYVVVTDPNDTQVFIIDVQEKLTPSLYELSGLEEAGK